LYKEPNKTTDLDLKTKSKLTVLILILIFIVVFGIYGYKFNSFSLSPIHSDWGVFGGYFGGVLSPVISAYVVYLIAKTYNLQKTELKELKDAQTKQLNLAAFSASLNSNLTHIGILQSEKSSLLSEFVDSSSDKKLALRAQDLFDRANYGFGDPDDEGFEEYINEQISAQHEYDEVLKGIKEDKGDYFVFLIRRIIRIKTEIDELMSENSQLKTKIEKFCFNSTYFKFR